MLQFISTNINIYVELILSFLIKIFTPNFYTCFCNFFIGLPHFMTYLPQNTTFAHFFIGASSESETSLIKSVGNGSKSNSCLSKSEDNFSRLLASISKEMTFVHLYTSCRPRSETFRTLAKTRRPCSEAKLVVRTPDILVRTPPFFVRRHSADNYTPKIVVLMPKFLIPIPQLNEMKPNF